MITSDYIFGIIWHCLASTLKAPGIRPRDEKRLEGWLNWSLFLRLCGFKTSVGFTKSLITGINAAASKEVLSKIPLDLPVLVIWGTKDPVTKNDLGTQSADQLEKQMKAAGRQLTKTIAYNGARHEVLLDAESWTRNILLFCFFGELRRSTQRHPFSATM